jgi:hypothetical protein
MNPRMDPFSLLVRDVTLIKNQVELLLRLTTDGKANRDPSINGFCARKGISRSMYNKLRRAGKGPRESAVGARRTVTPEAEVDWDREREAEAAAKRAERNININKKTPGGGPEL